MRALLAVAFLANLAVTAAMGQTVTPTTGAVFGTVTDSSHAVVPLVTVTLAGPTLITKQTALTDEAGVYRFPAVPPGDYGLTFELTGFASIVRQGIHVGIGFTATVDAELRPRSVVDSVNVNGAPIIDLTSTEVTTRFDSSNLATLAGRARYLCDSGQHPRHRDDQSGRWRQRRAQHAGVHRLRLARDNRHEPQ